MVECKLFEVRPVVQKIIFIVTIHKATQKNQNFGSLQSSYIRLYDGKSNGEIFRCAQAYSRTLRRRGKRTAGLIPQRVWVGGQGGRGGIGGTRPSPPSSC